MSKTQINQIMKMGAQQAYDACCEVKDIQPRTIEFYNNLPEDEAKESLSLHRVKTVIGALNQLGKWVADYTNPNQYKYYPWAWHKPGVGWVLSYVGYVSAGTAVGARLSSQNEEQARWAFETFIEDYNNFL